MKVRMYWLDLAPGPNVARRLVAEFELDDAGDLKATYYDEAWKAELEYNGIHTEPTGTLTPADGPAFLGALPQGFANSSRVLIESGDD